MKKNHVMLNAEVGIDLPTLIETKLAILANSGGGKSWAIRRVIEQAFGKVQIIVLDPEGEYSNLREKYDFILAGKDADAVVETRSAALLAIRLLETNASAIVDLYDLSPQDRKKFVRLFLESVMNAPKHLYHDVLIVLDEAHVFAPEKEQSEAAAAVTALASQGRKRGFCGIFATQRIAKMSKDVLAECNNRMIGRMTQEIDRKRAGEELGLSSKEEIRNLRNLKPGEFYAFGPAISDEIIDVRVGDVHVPPPKRGTSRSLKTPPPSAKVKAILAELKDLPQEAEKEAKTVEDLKSQVASLKREVAILRTNSKTVDPAQIEKAVAVAVEKVKKELGGHNVKIMRELIKRAREIEKHSNFITSSCEEEMMDIPLPSLASITQTPDFVTSKITVTPFPYPTNISNDDISISGPEQRILNAIGWLESINVPDPEQTAVAFLAGYTYGGGAFNNPKGSLKSKGLVEYVGGDKIKITEKGRSYAQIPETPLTREALHEKVMSVLETPHQRILKPLLESWPQAIPNDELARLSNYSIGGAFNNPKGRLRTLGLIEYLPGGLVRARDILFP